MEIVVTVLTIVTSMCAGIVAMSMYVPQAFPIREHRRAQACYRVGRWGVMIGCGIYAVILVVNYLI